MSIFFKAFAGTVAAALTLAVPAAAPAQGPTSSLRASEPPAIVAAAQSCLAAVTPEGLDEARLTADGWGRGSMSGGGGELIIFSRGDVLLLSTPGTSFCAVTARLRNMRAFPELSQALVAAFGRPSQSEANGTQMWLWEDAKVMRVEATGSRERPAVRIAIMHGASTSTGTDK